jgi:ELWxxDGT repeat protein
VSLNQNHQFFVALIFYLSLTLICSTLNSKIIMLRIYFTSTLLLLFVLASHAQSARLVKDITPGTPGSFSPSFFPEDDGIQLAFDDKILFIIEDSGNYDLWVTNGQEEDTELLIEDVGLFYEFMDGQDGNIYFSYTVTFGDYRLCSLDKNDLSITELYASEFVFKALAMLNNQLYIATRNYLIRIDPGSGNSEIIREFSLFHPIHDLHTLGNQLIIAGGDDGENGLLVSDGTAAGTQAYYSFNGAQNYNGDYFMTVVGDELFFFSNSADYSYALYRTDGTTEGTQVLHPFERILFYDLETRRSIIAWNNKLYFQAKRLDADVNDHELFVSDGTPEGTFSLAVSEFTDFPDPSDFTVYHDELYFAAAETGGIYTVYKTNGTQEGTVRAIDRNALGTGLTLGGQFLTVHEDSLYFVGYRFEVGEELWVSGGTTESTRVIDLVPGSDSGIPSEMTSTGGQLFFTYRSTDYGKEVFVLEAEDISASSEITTRDLRVFPNPLQGDVLTLQLPQDFQGQNINIELTDMLGRVVHRQASDNGTLNMAGLPTGMYVVTVRIGTMMYVGRALRG